MTANNLSPSRHWLCLATALSCSTLFPRNLTWVQSHSQGNSVPVEDFRDVSDWSSDGCARRTAPLPGEGKKVGGGLRIALPQNRAWARASKSGLSLRTTERPLLTLGAYPPFDTGLVVYSTRRDGSFLFHRSFALKGGRWNPLEVTLPVGETLENIQLYFDRTYGGYTYQPDMEVFLDELRLQKLPPPKLDGPGLVSGRVCGHERRASPHGSRRPMAGARVSVRTYRFYTEGQPEEVPDVEALTRTDASGRFTVRGLPAAAALVRCWADRYVGGTQMVNVRQPPHQAKVEFALRPKPAPVLGSLSGSVRDALDGSALLAPLVRVNGKLAQVFGSTYLARGIEPGVAKVEAIAPQHHRVSVTCRVVGDFTSTLDLLLPRPRGLKRTATVQKANDGLVIKLSNGVTVKVPLVSGRVEGFAEVSLDGQRLRDARPCGLPRIVMVKGGDFVEPDYTRCRYTGQEVEGEIVTVHSALELRDSERDRLDWVFAPKELTVANTGSLHTYRGLGYGFRFQSPKRRVYLFKHEATWELGADARQCSVTGQTRFQGLQTHRPAREPLFCFDEESVLWGRPFYLQSAANGTLLTYLDTPGAVSLGLGCENDGRLHHKVTLTVGARMSFFTPMLNVLFAPEPRDTDEWTAAFHAIAQRYRGYYGLSRVEESAPTVVLPIQRGDYGLTAPLRQIAEEVVPPLADLGFRRVNLSISNFDALLFPPGDGLGGEEGLKDLMQKIHDAGMQGFSWTGTHRYDFAFDVLKEHPEWIKRDPRGYIRKATDYSSWLSLKSGFADYALEQYRRWREKTSLDGLMFDLTPAATWVDFGQPEPTPEDDRLMQMIAQLQQTACTLFLPEGLSFLFGGFGADAKSLIYGIHNGREEKAFNTTWGFADHVRLAEFDYYKLAANKGPYAIDYLDLRDDPNLPALRRANHDFNAVSHLMEIRRVLPEGRGVEWTNNSEDSRVVFAFKEFPCEVSPEHSVKDITCGGALEPEASKALLRARHTYVVKRSTPEDKPLSRHYLYDVPYIAQSHPNTCGAAALAMLLRWAGKDVSEQTLLNEYPKMKETGFYIPWMWEYPQKLGPQTESGEGDAAKVKEWLARHVPVLVYQKSTEATRRQHFRVVIGYDEAAQAFIVHDPAPQLGRDYRIPYDLFDRLWDLPWFTDEKGSRRRLWLVVRRE